MRGLGALGVLVTGLAAGRLHAGAPSGLAYEGEVRVTSGVVHLEPGAMITVGRGKALQVEAQGAEVDLLHGDPAGRHLVGHFGTVAGLYRQDLSLIGTELPPRWGRSGGTLGLSCGDMLELTEGRSRLQAGPPEGCGPAALSVRAGAATTLSRVTVDGKIVAIEAVQLVPEHVMLGSGVGALTAALVGLSGALPLLLSPLMLLGPSIGLPGLGLGGVILATAGLSAAFTDPRRLRRIAGGLLTLGGLGLAIGAVLGFARPDNLGQAALDTERPMFVAVDRAMVMRKVQQAVDGFRAQKLPDHHPRVAALGSSSSGGGTAGRFWPQVLQDKLPEAQVVSLALGGTTSWHMRKVLETLDLRPELCILYMGHNDQVPSFPGLSIAALMRGEAPDPDHWVAPVPLTDAADNIAAMSQRCGGFLGVSEYARGRDAAVAAYAEMLAGVPGIRTIDAAAMFRTLPASAMLDDVHPSPSGQEKLAGFMLPTVRDMLATLTTTDPP